MKVAVLGASGRSGLAIVRALTTKGISVIAVVRSSSRVPDDLKDNVTIVEGEGTAPTTAQATLAHKPNVVVCAVGAPSPNGVQTVRTDVTRNFVNAIKDTDDVRFVAVSSVGAHKTGNQVDFITRAIVATILKQVMIDHTSQEDVITGSLAKQQWLVVRPTVLNDKPAQKDYQTLEQGKLRSAKISRNTLASFIVDQIVGNGQSYWGKKISISS